MKRLLTLVAAIIGLASAYLRSYEVLPTQANWSGWAQGDQQHGVGTTFTANFDSIAEVQVFIGHVGDTSHRYNVEVRDYATNDLIAHKYGVPGPTSEGHVWLHFAMTPDGSGKFTRGKEYVLKVTRPGDSVNWYKDTRNKYGYGHMVGGGTTLQPPANNDDLCARIYGLARVGNEFAVQSNVAWTTSVPGHETIPYMSPAAWDACIARESAVGVKYDKIGYGLWAYVQRSGPSQYVWGWLDTLMTSFATHGVRPIMSFRGTPGWASCAFESAFVNHVWIGRPSGGAIPRGLYEPVRSGDSINPDNYYAKYIYEFVRRYGPKGTSFNGSQSGTFWTDNSVPDSLYLPILLFEGFPEVPSGGLDRYWEQPGHAGGYWRLDEPLHYHFRTPTDSWPSRDSLVDPVYRETLANHIPFGGLQSDTIAGRKTTLAQTYARLIIVVDSAVKMACTSPLEDSARPRSLAYVSSDGDDYYTMNDWLNRLKSYGADEFFDVASLWGYAGVDYPRDHVANLQRVRSDLDDAGYDPRPCVFTEFGTSWPNDWSQTRRAYHLFEAYPFIQSANVIPPGYPALAGAWFTFTEQFMTGHHWSIIDDSAHDWQSWQPAYAYQQWSSLTQGASFEGQIPPWDNPGDTIYGAQGLQYRDSLGKLFWIAWQPMGSHWPHASVLRVPARADTESFCGVDTGGLDAIGVGPSEPSGWFAREFDTIPIIIREGESFSRPDLVVDSIMVPESAQVHSVMDVHAFVKNIGNRVTPDTVALDFLCDTTVFAHGTSSWPIAPGDSWMFSFEIYPIPRWMGGEHLFSARVNPGQTYVEKVSMDDNSGYLRRRISCAPDGRVDIIGPAICKMGAPILPLRLESHSWVSDSTGQTPADSARILFAWYGQRDSVVHATDTTAWFPFCTDTVFQFPRGCGIYSVKAQFRDSGLGDSPFYPDSTDSIIVFDSVPPGGSIIIEDGGRFVSNASCSLRLAASDSSAGVAMMRFLNRGRVNLARNGGFTATEGLWDFTNGAYDTSLSMAKLSVGPTQAGVRQFVPAESISAYAGDSCVLEASILAHMHDDDATGDVSFWFWSTNVNPEITDTLWQLVDSACYTGDLLSLTGLYRLSTRFLLQTPTPESGWVWRGGMVRVRAQGVDGGVGTVWCDNVALNAYEPQAAGYAWFTNYDTLCPEWGIGSTAGQHVVGAVFLDSAGSENAVPYTDTVILDPVAPVVDISLPHEGFIVDGLVEITGYAYDPVEGSGGEFFESRRLFYRSADSTNWQPVDPDSVSYQEAPPDSMSSQGPAVHLGYWNTVGLEDGPYYLLLTAADSASNASSCTTWVIVSNIGGGGEMGEGPEGGGTGMGGGSVYVGSATGTVLHLSDDLTVLDTFAVADSGSEACVTAILEVSDDSLLVLDAANRRVHKLHKDGQHRRRLVSNLSEPVDLKRDENGNLWLADRGTSKIGKFRPDGTLVFTRGGLGKDSLHFDSPAGIAIKGNLVYVADTKNDRIVLLDTSGKYRAVIKGEFAQPTAVFTADNGAIYLTDGSDGKLKGITPLGGNIVTIATRDSSKLRGLVPSENRHNLFSIAAGPNKVYKLRIQSDDSLPEGVQSGGKVNLPRKLSLSQPFPNPARTRLSIAYALPRQTQVALKLYDVAGKLVKALVNGEQKPGYYSLVWNRQDAKGRTCACGVYFCTLAAENQRFSRKVVLTE